MPRDVERRKALASERHRDMRRNVVGARGGKVTRAAPRTIRIDPNPYPPLPPTEAKFEARRLLRDTAAFGALLSRLRQALSGRGRAA